MKKRGLLLCLLCAITLSMSACGFHYKVTLNGEDVVNSETKKETTEATEETTKRSKLLKETTEEETVKEETSTEEETSQEETTSISGEDIRNPGKEIEISKADELLSAGFEKLRNTDQYILTLSGDIPTYQINETDILTDVEFDYSTMMEKNVNLTINKISGNSNGEYTTVGFITMQTNNPNAGWVAVTNNYGQLNKEDLITLKLGANETDTSTDTHLSGCVNPKINWAYYSDVYEEYTIYATKPETGMEKLEFILDKEGNLLEIYYDKGIGKDSGLYRVYALDMSDIEREFKNIYNEIMNSNTYLEEQLRAGGLDEFTDDNDMPLVGSSEPTENQPVTEETNSRVDILDRVYEKDQKVIDELEACLGEKCLNLTYSGYNLDILSGQLEPGGVTAVYGDYTVYDDNYNPIERTIKLIVQNKSDISETFSFLTLIDYEIY